MPKRKRESSEDRMRRKIKEYEERLHLQSKRHRSTVQLDQDDAITVPLDVQDEDIEDTTTMLIEEEPVLNKEPEEDALDEEILTLLGDAPREHKYGPNIHKELASRWANTIKNGLSKENRTDLKRKYLPPENCKTIDAPKLNLEAQAAVTDVAVKRDKAMTMKQNQIGCALTALAMAFDKLLDKSKNNIQTINYITDAARLLCDLQYQESITRRNFILQGFEQTTRDAVKDTEIDEWLFGEGFADKLKASKAIKKSGQEISINKSKKHHQQQQKKSLNFKGPVNYQPRSQVQQAGPQRNYQTYKKPVPRAQLAPQRSYSQNRPPLRVTNNRN